MPLNKLDNFIKNTEGRILYVSPSDLDSTDSIDNQGNSLARPFKTVQRALIEAARFSYVKGNNNDTVEKTTVLLMPGEHIVDNRPGYIIHGSAPTIVTPDGSAVRPLPFTLESNFDLNQKDNDLYKFNSVKGGVILPRGTSIVGLDLRKTKIRPKYVPNPTDNAIESSAIFRVTGACYLWQFSLFDGDEFETVYTQSNDFTSKATPTFSHHKLTCFEYADGVNKIDNYQLTDLEMYYAKLSIAYGTGAGTREIDQEYPASPEGFSPQKPEFEIVGAFAPDPISITSIIAGDGSTSTKVITVTTTSDHNLTVGTPIRISGISALLYNVSTKVTSVSIDNPKVFTYTLEADPSLIPANPISSSGSTGNELVTVETDTVTGASPYIFNISMRSVWGMNGMHADGSRATGFRSMVVAQFTGVSLQKDDRAFVKYNQSTRNYSDNIALSPVFGSELSSGSSSTGTVYHLDSSSIYRKGWETAHIRITNDAIMQVVSVFAIGFTQHFLAETGGDASITNSNSNFGQLALISQGFKKEAFAKDNKAFITHVIAPRAIDPKEEPIDWLSIDLSEDAPTNTTTKLYLTGFRNKQVKPPILTQGYRVGARTNDKLYLSVSKVEKSAEILMTNSINSTGFNRVSVSAPDAEFRFTSVGDHNFETGEKVIINSDDADLPENLKVNTVYFIIKVDETRFKLAASAPESIEGDAIQVYLGTNLTVTSRVSDKESGDVGHPVQFDESSTPKQWYINVKASTNTIQPSLSAITTDATEPTFLKRVEDPRNLDEKIYKLRIVVPNKFKTSKNPESGFIIQESSSTGFRTDTDANLSEINLTNPSFGNDGDYDFNRSPRFISTCAYDAGTKKVTVISELPHNLKVGDVVLIKNAKDSNITGLGTFNEGFNGTHTVTDVESDGLSFKYSTSVTPGQYLNNSYNNVGIKSTLAARFEINDNQSNIYIYRNEIISDYIENSQTGVYHIYPLHANNEVQEEFSGSKYSQRVNDLYPQLDRDNYDDNPRSSTSYALRSPLGEVFTNDLKKSNTRDAVNLFVKDFGLGKNVVSVTGGNNVNFDRNHGIAGIATYTTLNSGASYVNGTYRNVKLLSGGSNPTINTWTGATVDVTVVGGAVGNVEVVNPGSNYDSSAGLYFDQSRVGTGNGSARFNVDTTTTFKGVGDVIQFTGSTTKDDLYFRITDVPTPTRISVAKTTGDTMPDSTQYGIILGPAIQISTSSISNGVVTVETSTAHGLAPGNRFNVVDSSNNYKGTYLVSEVNSIIEYTFKSETDPGSLASGYVLKHGLSANGLTGRSGVSDKTAENLQTRAITFYDGDYFTLTSAINDSVTTFQLTHSGVKVASRLPIGSYIHVDNEIMRIAKDSLNGSNEITVIRGVLGTEAKSHVINSLVKKVRIPSIELRRPSILRASGHTFEYLGYGPGNYSTALPQVQDRTLTENEEFLSQSQEKSAGVVVYSGLNNRGDFFIGNQKKTAATGEETSFDTPIPTVTGEDPSRLSVVFDEVTIKERLVVEGGDSKQVLSEFKGPVTFSRDIKVDGTTKFTNTVKITSEVNNTLGDFDTGSVQLDGGIGIAGNTTIGGGLNVTGNAEVSGHIIVKDDKEIRIGDSQDLEIYHDSVFEDNANQDANGDPITGSTSASIIKEKGNGPLLFKTDGSSGNDAFKFYDADWRPIFIMSSGGSAGVEIYNGGSKKLETVTDGVDIFGNLDLTGSAANQGIIKANELDVPNISPVGSIMIWPGNINTWPTATWRLCNGAGGFSQATHPKLWACIGNKYGGNSSNFNLPNLQGKFVASVGTNTWNDTLGETGGNSNAVVVAHNHGITDTGHFHSHDDEGVELSESRYGDEGERLVNGGIENERNTTTETTGITINNRGKNTSGNNANSQTHVNANLPPYISLYYIIRIK